MYQRSLSKRSIMLLYIILPVCYLLLHTVPSQGQSNFITGRVFNEVSKSTLYNAKLILKRNNKYHQKTKTDHVGNYWFGDLPYGSYSIWVIQNGYCELEISRIELSSSTSIHLDLGMIEAAQKTNINSNDKIYKIYQAPIQLNLDIQNTAYQNFESEIHIINEVYHGPEIRIAPKHRSPSPIENNRATHYHESLKGLGKKTPYSPR